MYRHAARYALPLLMATAAGAGTLPDTGQGSCYNDSAAISCPAAGASWYGQDAQYQQNPPSYTNNGDGTITDNVTGLMWQQDPDLTGDGVIDAADRLSFSAAQSYASNLNLGGHTDWRLPTIKELYSLIDFSGVTGTSASYSTVPADAVPYIDTAYFDFAYGDTSAGMRYIDAQYWSSTEYVSTTMQGDATVFGVNFADGRIKGYPKQAGATEDLHYVRMVRGASGYGVNSFTNHGDSTVSDAASGLMWMTYDSGHYAAGSYGDGRLNWQQALAWCEGLSLAGYADWRLPNAKELESLVDYSRSLATTSSPAIDPLFSATWLANGVNNSGAGNYPYYWSSTTHLDGQPAAMRAVYVAFGEARGFMDFGSGLALYDVHGAGAQRSDPKSGDPSQYPTGWGPQGDVIGIYNYARCVRPADSGDARCPSGSDVTISNVTYSNGEHASCTGKTSLTAGPAVTVESGASVDWSASSVQLLPGFTAAAGASFSASAP